MKRHIAYLKAVIRHKWYVFLACLQFGVPIWTALLHDWDKFLPDEWLPYARTFYKPNGEKQYVESVEFARAWMLHQHRNKHHWQYWVKANRVADYDPAYRPIREQNILIWDRGAAQQLEPRGGQVSWRLYIEPYWELRNLLTATFSPDPMSDAARREMLADWFGAGRAYNADWTPLEPRKWYEKNKDNMILHSQTRDWVERELVQRELTWAHARARELQSVEDLLRDEET